MNPKTRYDDSAQPEMCRRPIRRSGAIYVLVLGMGMLVSVMVLGVLISNRIQARSTAQSSDSLFAETLAESAVDYAIVALNANASWRTTYTNAVESSTVSVGGGTIAFKLIDEISGNLSTTATNPVRVYGIGRYGSATRVYSVRVEGKNALTCLNAAVTAGGNISESKNANLQASGFTLATNAAFVGNTSGGSSTVNANVEAVGTVTLNSATILGRSSAGVTARLMPVSTVIDTYVTMGTSIAYSSIPSGIIQNVVISPASNPYSTALNLKGIYVIDCGGSNLVITHCRIAGTLVILNPGSGSSIGTGTSTSDQINWAPAISNYPCLIVRGNMQIAWSTSSGQTLNETDLSAGVYNFNPTGTPYPYPSGSTNILVLDTYPSIIDGLVYVTGNVTGNGSGTSNYPTIDQLIVGGTYDPVKDTVTYSYKGNYLATPPPGFRGGGTLVAVPSSWRWEPVQ